MPNETHHSCVARVPIFADLSPGQQDQVAAFARPVHVPRGEIVYMAGSDLHRLVVVHRGRIAMRHLSADGRERVVRVLGEGDVVGEAAFVTGERPDHEAVATADSELCTLDHADLVDLVRRYPRIAVRMLQSVTERLVRAERMLATFAITEVETRVAAWLLDQPTVDDGGRRMVILPMAKKDIASFLGTTPETLSRRLAGLAREGLIGLAGRRGIVLLDTPALEARAAGLTH
ncbi:MAG: Crp/Fnr family transcriptional regulator [Chloroflexi bacterium]|nr:Crp/Fnr family transcriptional regulator [Chloroflexota bacterium]